MKLTKKVKSESVDQGALSTDAKGAGLFGRAVNRRTFLRHSGVTAGGAAIASIAAPTMVKKVRGVGYRIISSFLIRDGKFELQ